MLISVTTVKSETIASSGFGVGMAGEVIVDDFANISGLTGIHPVFENRRTLHSKWPEQSK